MYKKVSFYLMSTIAQKIQTFILRIHNKNNLTDVQFSFEETNIHQKILLKKAPHHGHGVLKNT